MARRAAAVTGRRQAPPLRVVLAVAFACATAAYATAPTAADRELFAAADLQRAMPAAFHAEVRVEPLAGPGAMGLDLWRAGDDALLRFADAKQRGKAYLQHGAETWFLAPGARAVRLGGAQRLAAGINLQEIVGLDWSRDFKMLDVVRQPASGTEVVTFVLQATAAGMPFPRVDYVVRADTKRPLRIESRTASGKVARILELAAWLPGRRLAPAVLVVKDLVTGRPPVRVRFTSLEERPPPPHLFEIGPAGDAARAALR